MQVRFYAVGRELAGVEALTTNAASMQQLTVELGERYGERMARLVAASTLLHDGVRRRSSDEVTFADADVVDLLPPFAGG